MKFSLNVRTPQPHRCKRSIEYEKQRNSEVTAPVYAIPQFKMRTNAAEHVPHVNAHDVLWIIHTKHDVLPTDFFCWSWKVACVFALLGRFGQIAELLESVWPSIRFRRNAPNDDNACVQVTSRYNEWIAHERPIKRWAATAHCELLVWIGF